MPDFVKMLRKSAEGHYAHADIPASHTHPKWYKLQAEVMLAAANEIEALRAWKAEATEVIGSWEQVWEALGRPGRLGESKAAAVLRAVGSDSGSRFEPCTHDWVRCVSCRKRVLTGSEDKHRCPVDSGRSES